MPYSANRWPVLSASETVLWTVTPALPPLRLAAGPAGFILCHWALWHHDVVEVLTGRVQDDWGYAYRPIRGGSGTWSNHASGTAVDLNALDHPMGSRSTYRDPQMRAIRTRLRRRYGGFIGWGGDWRGRSDEMHYELVCSRTEARALADRLRDTSRGRRLVAGNPGVTHW